MENEILIISIVTIISLALIIAKVIFLFRVSKKKPDEKDQP